MIAALTQHNKRLYVHGQLANSRVVEHSYNSSDFKSVIIYSPFCANVTDGMLITREETTKTYTLRTVNNNKIVVACNTSS